MEGYPEQLILSANDWPQKSAQPHPGNLRYFLPQGFGMGDPNIVMPYGAADPSFYGFDQAQAHPFRAAPTTDDRGGTFYFDKRVAGDSLKTALELVGVERGSDYVAYAASSEDPVKDRYLDQLRLVSVNALTSIFEGRTADPLPGQKLTVVEAVQGFVQAQKEKWDDGYTYSSKLRGTAGGDGDWAKESLAFGFHVENTYWGIYRVWSRAWLVTK